MSSTVVDSSSANSTPPCRTSFDDPFDDPALVTTAFLDIMYQDERGFSALMIAAAEGRMLHLKGILAIADASNRLKQCLELRNVEGETALDIALKSGNEEAKTAIERFVSGKRKQRPQSRSRSSVEMALRSRGMASEPREASEDDVIPEFVGSSFQHSDTSRTTSFGGGRPPLPPSLSRQKIRQPSQQSLDRRARSVACQSRKPFGDSGTGSEEEKITSERQIKDTRSNSHPVGVASGGEKTEEAINGEKAEKGEKAAGIFSSLGERIKNFMHRKSEEGHDEGPSENDEKRSESNQRLPGIKDNKVVVRPEALVEDFRSSPWTSETKAVPPPSNTAYSSATSSSSSSFRLPPLMNLRRRANSEGRNVCTGKAATYAKE